MKNHYLKKLLLFVGLISFNLFGQTSLYEHPDFANIAKEHKKIAVLPFKTTIKLRPKQMKEISTEQLAELEIKEGLSVQNGMYSWFLKRKKRGNLTVSIQDPNRTNAILNKNGITQNNLSEFNPEDLAKILEVDAIVSGTLQTNKPMSEGASLAIGILAGFWGSTNTALANISIHNASDGELLWNYNKKVGGSIGSSSEDMINILMRKASRRLAYTKNKM